MRAGSPVFESMMEHSHEVNLVRGKILYVFDDNGSRCLDFFGGIATVGCGHCDPDVVNAIINQIKLFCTSIMQLMILLTHWPQSCLVVLRYTLPFSDGLIMINIMAKFERA
ncbi:Alanine--glyoxylate aminotransferase 23 [Abeliophyllum distichum]|uniref:Alanine--glyoxylate aminotransferase 23 n=1 Tax=Abeliophyllum distichum TaxID=126358 RepID=A0ABD1VYU4_9LAMI